MDHDEHLRQHDEQIQHLVALNVTMVDAIARIDATLERLTTNLEVVTALLQRRPGDEHTNGQETS